MTIANLIDKKGLGQIYTKQLKKIGKALAGDESTEAIAKWLHYDLNQPKHTSEFLNLAAEITKYGYLGASINRQSDFEEEAIKNDYYSDLSYGAWHKNQKELYNNAEELINDFYCEFKDNLEHENKNGDIESLILLTTRQFVESTMAMAMELKI